jgi:hypothetical protein
MAVLISFKKVTKLGSYVRAEHLRKGGESRRGIEKLKMKLRLQEKAH